MTKILIGPSSSLADRLGAALEAIVIGDRWVAYRQGGDDRTWQAALLRVAQACASGDDLSHPQWQVHFQGVSSPAALLINALPHLWINADAHGHRRAAVGRWAADLDLGEEGAEACDQLFLWLCRSIKFISDNSISSNSISGGLFCCSEPLAPALGQALALAAQSQGQAALALTLADRRGWSAAQVALVGLLLGLSGGRAGLGGLRQPWLLSYGVPPSDPWLGLGANPLGEIALALHHRWAGVGVAPSLDGPAIPRGIRV